MAALSHAWMDASPLRVCRSGANVGPRKGWAVGDACMRAVQFALLAKRGQPGASTVLTQPRWGFYDTMWRGGERFVFHYPIELGL
jgi:2-methylcitrate dehydratase